MKHIFSTLGCMVLLGLAAFSCHKEKDTRPVLTVSIEAQRHILEQLVGDRYRVVTLLPAGADPEAFEPSMKSRRDVDNSELYFITGQLPFESLISMSAADNVRVINTSYEIEPIYGTHGHEHSVFLGNGSDSTTFSDPHYWASVRNMRKMTQVMARELQRIDPDNANDYNRRYLAIDAHLDSLDEAFSEALSNVKPRTFLVWHPTLAYFARDYDLEQLAVCDDNKEVSINALRAIMDEAVADSVKVFFAQGYCTAGQADAIHAGTNTRRVDINLTGYDWEDQFKLIVDELCKL